jgi:hypothetical protein
MPAATAFVVFQRAELRLGGAVAGVRCDPWRMTNDEVPNDEGMTKSEVRFLPEVQHDPNCLILRFDIRHRDFIRH